MASFPTLSAFARTCRKTDKVVDLWHRALAFFKERKIERVSYHADDAQQAASPPLGIVTHNFPDSWVCTYLEQELHRIDPIPKIAAKAAHPFYWSEAGKLADLDPDAQRYMEILENSDLGDGLAIQVYGPNMRNAYMGLGFGTKNVTLSAEEIFELQCGAQIAHMRYCALTEDRQRSPDPLSPREEEILQWIARGKSSSVIADILGISRHTVDTLTRRIFDKLGVNDRTSAAIRGLGAGLVRYRHGRVA
jgi:LuxR family transcriptional regulator/LuxR family quorum-sensing system transcriptional regulator CciR